MLIIALGEIATAGEEGGMQQRFELLEIIGG